MGASTVLTIHIDGASRGNPGPAACAYVISQEREPVIEEAERLQPTTNNVAEYTALVRALSRAVELNPDHVLIRSDSELLVRQMNGQYQVKNDQLRRLFKEARRLADMIPTVRFVHVPREENSRADRLCNEVLDGSEGRLKKAPRKAAGAALRTRVEGQAVECLRAALECAASNSRAPTAEEVWAQLWTILEENQVLKR